MEGKVYGRIVVLFIPRLLAVSSYRMFRVCRWLQYNVKMVGRRGEGMHGACFADRSQRPHTAFWHPYDYPVLPRPANPDIP
jgi:hypothetical protein